MSCREDGLKRKHCLSSTSNAMHISLYTMRTPKSFGIQARIPTRLNTHPQEGCTIEDRGTTTLALENRTTKSNCTPEKTTTENTRVPDLPPWVQRLFTMMMMGPALPRSGVGREVRNIHGIWHPSRTAAKTDREKEPQNEVHRSVEC